MATQSELAQIQHILGKRRTADHNPLDLSARKKSREYLDSHKDVEKRRRDRINTCLDTIRTLVPLCNQLPRHRRVDKADLLDLAIIYLRMVNKFLEKIGITDIFSAAHQQVNLFTSLEKWVRHQGEKHTDVPTFTKEILGLLEREMENASHVIASQQTTSAVTVPGSESGLQQQEGVEWMKHERPGHFEDEPSTPRSYHPHSGSDEESLVSSNGDREGKISASDDSVPSPAFHSTKTDFLRKCPVPSSSREESYDVYENGCGNCSCHCVKSAMSNGYVVHYRDPCHAIPKPRCVDKAVNTDANLMNFSWPPDSTFTLPIVSGKIVLRTPFGASGSNNLNAPVTLHAEIHSSPQEMPLEARKVPNGAHDEGTFKDDMMCSGSALCEKCGDSPRSISIPRSDEPLHSANHVSCAIAYPSSRYPLETPQDGPVTIITPSAVMPYPERNCLHHIERGPSSAYPEDTRQGERCDKSYASLTTRQQMEEGSVAALAGGDSRDFSDSRRYPDICCNAQGQGESPFSDRFLASLGRHQTESNHNNNNIHRSQFSDRFPTASSSLKLKSLMVHRHQSQHVLS